MRVDKSKWKHLYIFNPDSDLAIAADTENFTAPTAGRELQHDLAALPAWIARGDDAAVLVFSCEEKQKMEEIAEKIGICPNFVLPHDIPAFIHFSPWGWNKAIRKWLITQGANPDYLPAIPYLEQLRHLSHRRMTVDMCREMGITSGIPHEIFSFEEAKEYAESNIRCYMKQPWSGSGRGIFHVLDLEAPEFKMRISGGIKRQGSVMGEPERQKLLDFALEFNCNDGKAEFAGYSVFTNDRHNSFDNALVASSSTLETIIAKHAGSLNMVTDCRKKCLSAIEKLFAPYYSGYLGVDMMVCKYDNGAHYIYPCVEINVRTTMGVVTSKIGNKFIPDGEIGNFKISFIKNDAERAILMEKINDNPPVFDNKLLIHGIMPLSPIRDDSHYIATLSLQSFNKEAAMLDGLCNRYDAHK